MKQFILAAIFCLQLLNASSQNDIIVKLNSENKLLWKEEVVLADQLTAKYREEILNIEAKILQVFKKEFAELTERSTRAESVSWSPNPVFSIEQNTKATSLKTAMYYNSISFRVTTPDIAFGIGADRSMDPSITIEFVVIGKIPIHQDKTLQSIKVLHPSWSVDFKLSGFEGDKVRFKGSLDKTEIEQWLTYNLPYHFSTVFMAFNFDDILNSYINENIRNNKKLRMEIDIDNDENLEVLKHGENELVFQHRYSSAGILKRGSKKDASVITEEHTYTPAKTESEKPVDANLPANSANPASKNPPSSTSTSPGDMNKGPLSTKQPPPKVPSNKGTKSPGGIIQNPKPNRQ
jgi:hypothetical protein